MITSKAVMAARKAVFTLRLNKLKLCSRVEVKKLTEEIKNLKNEIDNDYTYWGIIEKEIGPTTWKSFCRFGDRKKATKSLILTWINNTSFPLDAQAHHMGMHYEIDFDPSDLAEYMITNDNGISEKEKQLRDLYQTFKEVTGFNYYFSFKLEDFFPKRKKKIADCPF